MTRSKPAMEAYGRHRYGLGECECWHESHGDPYDPTRAGCPQRAKMWDGWYICWRCKRHAPQLAESKQDDKT